MTLQQFVDKYEGKSIDQGWGVQCVALVRHYWERVCGLARHRQPNTTPSGGALDLSNNMTTGFSLELHPVPGDVAVWPATPGNKWGHTAVVIDVNSDGSFEVLEQDGFAQHRGAYKKVHTNRGTFMRFNAT